MQREIEALLKAYVEDRQREGQLVTDLLTAIALGAASRRQMIDDIAFAVGRVRSEGAIAPVRAPVNAEPAQDYDPVSDAVGQLRSARELGNAH